jgi:hypothetical protein
VTVVVVEVFGEGCLELAAVDDEYPVEPLSPGCADPSFRIRIRPQSRYRRGLGRVAFGGEDRIEHGRERRGTVTDQELTWLVRSPRSISRLGRCPSTGETAARTAAVTDRILARTA